MATNPKTMSAPMAPLTGFSRLLEGKVAIVTGASRGIGAAAARAFADAGARVVVAARGERELDALAAEIVAAGGEALPVGTDVTEQASVQALIEQTTATYGRLDCAFNNAGLPHRPAPLTELGVEDFEEALAVNARGVFLAMKYEIAAMVATGGGAIVNMSSTAGLQGVKGMAGYVAAKHAVLGLTRTAALDYADRGIRVNAVAPGPILTGRLEALDDATRRKIGSQVPLGRIGSPEDVAAAVAWLLSDNASFLTGATIPVDGGGLVGAA
jgi:NAD(P)-dependent dehydrogenase (short-subunit alcohol dehydrogenase family)